VSFQDRFEQTHLVGIEAVRQGGNRSVGLLYLNLDLQALYGQIALYSLIALGMTGVAFPVALRVPSPSGLQSANTELARELTERKRAEGEEGACMQAR
jgi:hypothetical protein